MISLLLIFHSSASGYHSGDEAVYVGKLEGRGLHRMPSRIES
ncbi:hypothetical protein ABZU75_29995 [Streptosporangium sp. NPDC005286]